VLVCAEVSTFLHACEGDAVTKLTNEKVPYFNAPIYLQNKTQIGKVDEIFGPINESVSSSSPCCLLPILLGTLRNLSLFSCSQRVVKLPCVPCVGRTAE
jgi:hypothetical protein